MPELDFLHIQGVTKRFGEGDKAVTAVKDMSFYVREGSFLSILGPSGCGKSTLFNIMAGLMAPTSGDVCLRGQSIVCRPGNVGYMLQRDLLLPWRTIEDNIGLGQTLHGVSRAKARQEAGVLLASCGLAGKAKKRPDELSGGMRQRAALLRTLATQKDILLLDEPFGALDAITRLRLQLMLLKIWQETHKTILFVTHDVEEAILLGDEVLVLSGSPGTVRERLTVPLPRPRSERMLVSPDIAALRLHLTELLKEANGREKT